MQFSKQQEAATEQGPLLSREQAAAYLGVSPNTLAVWACNKTYGLKYIRVGRCARYRRADLDAWLEQREVGIER